MVVFINGWFTGYVFCPCKMRMVMSNLVAITSFLGISSFYPGLFRQGDMSYKFRVEIALEIEFQ